MKQLTALALALMVVSAPLTHAGPGPAPNAGDGVSDGGGWEPAPPTGPYAPETSPAPEPTPAPCSGDGYLDGGGLDDDCYL